MAATGTSGQWRLILAAAGVSGVLAVLSTLLSIGYFEQRRLREASRQESQGAMAAAEVARQAAHRGLRARDQAEELVGFLLDDLRDELYQLGRSDLLLAATERSVAYFDHLPPELVTPDSQAKHASALLTLSDARYQQGDYPAAIATALRSISLWKLAAASADPEGARTIRVGRALGELALYQYQSGDPYAARETYAEMLRLYEDPKSPIQDEGWRSHGLAKVHLGLGEIERRAKNYPDARRQFAEAIKHISAAIAHRPDELSWVQMLMTVHNNLGVVWMHEKEYAAAEASFHSAVGPNRTLIRREPKNRRWEKELATTLQNLGALLHLQKDFTRAEAHLREALTLRQGLADWDPKSTRAIRKLAHSHHRMNLLLFDTGNPTNALAGARHALAALQRLILIDPEDESTVEELLEYTVKYRERLAKAGMSEAAERLIQENLAFAESARGGKPGSALATAWNQLVANLRGLPSTADTGPNL